MPSEVKYHINDLFYSLQGEGARAGTANIFLRFSGCNLKCTKAIEGFNCDTEFVSGRDMTLAEIVEEARSLAPQCDWIVLTGGEPALQIDHELIGALKAHGYKLAIETNGTIELKAGIDWITVSPKVAEHTIVQRTADEVKYVRGYGQELPKTSVKASYKWISPAFEGDYLDPKVLEWCVKLVKENPDWGLSLQQHKLIGIR